MSARLLLSSAPQSCEPSSTLINSVLITSRSSSLTSRPVRTAPTFRLRPASTGSTFALLKRKAALRDITFRFGSRERLLMMLSVKPSDKYSAFGSLLSLTNGRIATELIGRDAEFKKNAAITANTTSSPTAPNVIHFVLFVDCGSVGARLGTVAGSATVSTCDLVTVVVDRCSACVIDEWVLDNSGLSVV